MPYNAQSKVLARRFITRVRRVTRCLRCGGKPIEWHNPTHLTRPNMRVAHLVALGFPVHRIQAEIDSSEPLCRSCHMRTDGRLDALMKARPRQRGSAFPAKPCLSCGQEAKPLRRGLCNRCDHIKRKGKSP